MPMFKSLLATLLLILPLTLAAQTLKPKPAAAASPSPQVLLHTSQGDITLAEARRRMAELVLAGLREHGLL